MPAIAQSQSLLCCHSSVCLTLSYTWWRDNAARFPLLSVAARRYLAAPATSVPSERLFSSAGDISDDKRTCLLAENLERLVFLKANLM